MAEERAVGRAAWGKVVGAWGGRKRLAPGASAFAHSAAIASLTSAAYPAHTSAVPHVGALLCGSSAV